ncbi:MAG: LysE family transporter [Arcobacteraceae bacterium]
MIINSILQGFVFGLGAAVPIGPINILIMDRALQNYKSAVAIGAGALTADITYLVLILLGLVTFFNHPIFLNFLSVFGSGFLLFIAYMIFKGRDKKLNKTTTTVDGKTIFKSYIGGFFLTLLNPYTIAFWLSVATFTSNGSEEVDYFILVGMICAISMWITIMPYLVHRSKHKISQKVSYYIALFSSVVLAGFAVSLFVNSFLM